MFPPSARRRAAALALGLVLATATGCSGTSQAPRTRPAPTPIEDLNAAALQVPRIAFCGLVRPEAVRSALGAAAESSSSWGNGEVATVSPGVRDVVHELGCAWTAAGGAAASAWVFARPVTASFAASVVAQARGRRGCSSSAGPAFGSPTLSQVCREAGGSYRVRHAGLFGDSWLTCEVTGAPGEPAPEVREGADAWCVQVTQALDGAS